MTYSQWKQKSVDKTLSASFNTQNNKVNSKLMGEIDFDMLPNKELYNAIVIHKHPKIETYFTFSLDDINFFLENKLSELYGFDHKYEYVMKPKEETIYEEIHKNEYDSICYEIHDGNNCVEISDEILYHLVVKGISERYNFIYERKLRT